MKMQLFAAAAAIALAISAPAFAAGAKGGHEPQTNAGTLQQPSADSASNVNNRCAEILASPEQYGSGDVEYCRAHGG